MMVEAFRRLYPFQRVSDYRYIGFGSIYFTDFQLVHRTLGISDMISIEKNDYAKECFEFNRPYRAIDLQFGYSNAILPRCSWDKHTILWLDYDGRLDRSVLADSDTFCLRASSGSVLVVSVNAEPDREPTSESRSVIEAESGEPFNLSAYRLSKLEALLGDKIPPGTKGTSLRGDGVARVFRSALLNEIDEVLTTRNALLKPSERLTFRQIFHFEYKDGARMVTVGGLLVSGDDEPRFEACSFEKLDFVRSAEDSYLIRVPCLTAKEVRHLNTQLPCPNGTALYGPGIPEADLKTYSEMYRYFPSFSEILFG
jgi:hypothetical protein